LSVQPLRSADVYSRPKVIHSCFKMNFVYVKERFGTWKYRINVYTVTTWIIPEARKAGVGNITVPAQSVWICNSNRLRGGTQNKDVLTHEEPV
jgi:hypothetical protein